MLEPSYYFNYPDNAFWKGLFKSTLNVLEVLKNLSGYLENQNLGKIDVVIPEGVYLENAKTISIGEGTVIEPGVYIKGPAWIGKNCQIRCGAYIRGNVIIGDGAVVGHDTEVKHSILLPRAHAAHFNYVGDSILGSDTNLGSGVACANFRLDQGEISVEIEGEKVLTGFKKLGLILGDRSQIGCNSVTSPGTLIGKDVLCPSTITIKGTIPSKAKIRLQKIYSIEV
jgi:NDP-sugar pyrophosphorylase family protein